MDYSIDDNMFICGHVRNKCCTLYDEVKIHKYWNEYTKPILDLRAHNFMLYTKKIIDNFHKLMSMDPQLMVLKHVITKQVPYEHESCYIQTETENGAEELEFHSFNDKKMTLTYAKDFYKQIINKNKKFNVKVHTHDRNGERHWGIQPSAQYTAFKKTYGQHGTPTVSHDRTEVKRIKCKRQRDTFVKDFIVINEPKTKFCLGLYEKFLDLDNNYLKRFLPSVNNLFKQMMDLKGSMYCSLCDAHQQEFFNMEKRIVNIKEEFCSQILENKKDLIQFMHIFLIEYMDNVLQYTQCYETDSKVYIFPFKNFLEKYKRRIPLIKSCYESLDKNDFMERCWFLCDQYKFFGLDDFFAGDVDVVKRVYLAITSFVHKLSVTRPDEKDEKGDKDKNKDSGPDLLLESNVDGLLVEPINPSFAISDQYYLDDVTRKHLLGKLDTRVKPKPSPAKKKKIAKKADALLKAVGLPDVKKIEALKKEHKELKKKVQKAEELEKGLKKELKKDSNVKDFLSKFKKKAEKKIKKKEKLRGFLANIKKKSELKGHMPPRWLLNDPSVMSDIKKGLLEYGLPAHIINQLVEESRIKARYLQDKKTEDNKPDDSKATEDKKDTSTTDELAKANKDKKEDEKDSAKADEQKKTEAENTDGLKQASGVIESASEFFEKGKYGINAKQFEPVYSEDGINPLQNYGLIDYKFNITDIIYMNLKPEEELNPSVIKSFFDARPKIVNKFNLDIDSFIQDAKTVTNATYERLKKLELFAKIHSKTALLADTKKKIKKIVMRVHRSYKREKAYKQMVKEKKERLKKKALEKATKIIDSPMHVNQKHFHQNFNGFKDYFLSIFGN